jgi:ABC-type amino acid transport substrate-binding protein
MTQRLLNSSLQMLISACLICLVPANAEAAPETIRYTAGTINEDPRQNYFIQMLTMALEAAGEADQYQLEPVTQLISQERAFTLAASGQGLGVFWGMTSKAREQRAIPIKVPLLKGLLGYRMLVTRSEWVPDLAQMESLDQLKRLSIAQGFGWPDNQILKSNGLSVYTGSYHALFDWVAQKRADLFPRSVYEVWAEQSMIERRGLVIAPSPVVYYFGPIYFFVPKSNPKLAETIQKGLDIAIQDGRFDDLFYQQPEVKKALGFLTDGQPHTVLYLHNPEYSETEVQEVARKGYLLVPMEGYSTAE